MAVISRDPLFSNALCTLFALERLSCAALGLEEGLTYAAHQSNGCVVLHVETDEIPSRHVVRWLELGVGVVILSETLSEREAREVLRFDPVVLLKVPVNSRDLLSAVYSVLAFGPKAGHGEM